MSIRIVTDSTCDLPPSLVAEYNITVLPLFIHMEGSSYLDGIDISRQEFYERLPGCKTPPTTAAPGTQTFVSVYRRLADEGASAILSIHISPTLSAVLNVAQAAAAEFDEIPVTVLDSRQLSLGAGFIVLAAARAAAAGSSMEEILALIEELIPRTYVFAAIPTMEYLRRSGRVNGLISGIGNLLRLKPILKMHNGVAASERVRTNRRAYRRLVSLVEQVGPISELALVHTNAAEKAQRLWEMVKEHAPAIKNPLSVDVTSVLGVHLGPGVVGFACVAAPES
jgi:DegV family protein with EDD domain